MSYIGDFALESTFDTKFCTVTTTGAPTTLAGTPVISAYVGNSTTQLTAGITLTVDFDAVTGLHNVRVVATAANGYATASNYQLVITTGTVGGTSVVGYVIAEFSIENRSDLRPTTAGRTLDVSAGGEAGVDWANVGTPGSTVGLSATTVATVTTTTTATNVTTVNGLAASVITAASIATDAITAAKIADGAIDAATFAAGAINAAAIATDAIGAAELAADAVTEIRSLASGTSDSGTTTTMVDAARTEADTDYWAGQLIVFTSGNIIGQARVITAFNAATDTVTFAPAATQAVATQTYEIWPGGDYLRPTTTGRTLDVSTGGEAGVDWANVGSPTTALNLSATNIDVDQIVASVSGAVGSVTGAVGSVTGAVGSVTGAVGSVTGAVGSVTGAVGSVTGAVGSVTGAVGSIAAGGIATTSFAAGAIDAAAIAANAIGASELAQDAAREVADEILDRDLAGGASGGSRGVRNALRALRNKQSIAAGTLTVTQEDDVTSAWTATIVTTAGNPISSIDPA